MSLKSNKQKGTLPKREEEENNEKEKSPFDQPRLFRNKLIQGYLKSQFRKSKRSNASYFDLRVVANYFPFLSLKDFLQ